MFVQCGPWHPSHPVQGVFAKHAKWCQQSQQWMLRQSQAAPRCLIEIVESMIGGGERNCERRRARIDADEKNECATVNEPYRKNNAKMENVRCTKMNVATVQQSRATNIGVQIVETSQCPRNAERTKS